MAILMVTILVAATFITATGGVKLIQDFIQQKFVNFGDVIWGIIQIPKQILLQKLELATNALRNTTQILGTTIPQECCKSEPPKVDDKTNSSQGFNDGSTVLGQVNKTEEPLSRPIIEEEMSENKTNVTENF